MNDGGTPLIVACQEGHTEVVTTLLAANADVNKADNYGATPLMRRLPERPRRGRHDIDANAVVNHADNKVPTPLFVACQMGHTEVVAKLLAANASVDHADNEGATPLFIACQKGHTEVVTALLAANADVNHAMDDGGTSLQIACPKAGGGRQDATRGARPPRQNHIAKNNCTALQLAQMHEHPEVIQILERAQARSRMHALLPQHASSVHAAPAWLKIGVLVEVHLHEPSWNVTGHDPFEMNWFRGTCVAIGPGQARVEFDDISDQESHMIDDVRFEHLRPRPPTGNASCVGHGVSLRRLARRHVVACGACCAHCARFSSCRHHRSRDGEYQPAFKI